MDIRSGIYLARIETHTTITPTGLVRSETVMGKSYGPKDLQGTAQLQVRQGQLTPKQLKQLADLMHGWDSLQPAYYGVPDGGDTEWCYGEKVVWSHGGGLPESAATILDTINDWTGSMLVITQTTRPAWNGDPWPLKD